MVPIKTDRNVSVHCVHVSNTYDPWLNIEGGGGGGGGTTWSSVSGIWLSHVTWANFTIEKNALSWAGEDSCIYWGYGKRSPNIGLQRYTKKKNIQNMVGLWHSVFFLHELFNLLLSVEREPFFDIM